MADDRQVVIRFVGDSGGLAQTTTQAAQGIRGVGDAAQQTNQRLGNTSQEVSRLAQALNTNYRNAQQFASGLGLSAQKAGEAVVRLRELDRVGATNAEKFRALARELGVTRQQFEQLNATAGKSREGLLGLAGATGGIAAGLGAIAVSGAQQFASFDGAIRTFGVVTNASGEQVGALRAEVERLARVTTKTPQEVANLAVELGKAGFNADQTKVALAGVVQSSEATGEGLVRTGEVIGAALNQFGLSSDKSLKIADLLTAASNASAAGTNDLGEALSYAGAQAKASNQTIEDTITTLALLAQAGIKGSSAGTGFAEALRRIKLASANATTEFEDLRSKGSKSAVAAFEQLNASVREADGKLKPFPQVLANIKRALNSVGQETDKELILNALFGVQGGRTVQSLLNLTNEQIQQVTGSMQAFEGGSLDASQALTRGLGASFKLFESSTQLAAQKVGEFVSIGLEPLIRIATEVINFFLALPAPVQAIVVGIGAFTAALSAAVAITATYQALNIATTASLVARTAATIAATVVTNGATAAQFLFNTTVTASGAAALAAQAGMAALTLVQGVFAAATGAATGAIAAFQAALLPVLLPLAALAAAIKVVSLIKETLDLKQANEDLDSLGEGARVAGDAAITMATKTKSLNAELKSQSTITDEQRQRAQQLIKLNQEQIKSLQDQLTQVKAVKPANEEQANAQKALEANIQSSINALQSQTTALSETVGAKQQDTQATKANSDAQKANEEARKKAADALKEQRAKEKQAAEDQFKDDQETLQRQFEDDKRVREEQFSDRQRTAQEQFQDQQTARREAAQEQEARIDRANQEAKAKRQEDFKAKEVEIDKKLQAEKQTEEDTFSRQQEALDRQATAAKQERERQFQDQQRQRESTFNTQQQQREDTFNTQQQEREAAFKEQQRQRDAQQSRNFGTAERLLQLEGAKDAKERQRLQQQEAIIQKVQELKFTPGEVLTPETLTNMAKQVAGVTRIATDEQLKLVQDTLKLIEDKQKSDQAEADRQAEIAFKEQQRQAEVAFNLQQQQQEVAFKEQQRLADVAFKAEQDAADLAQAEAKRQRERDFKAELDAIDVANQQKKLEREKQFKVAEDKIEEGLQESKKRREKSLQLELRAEEKTFQEQQRAEKKAFDDAERQLQRQFEDDKQTREREFKQQQREFDKETAEQVKQILQSTKIPAPEGTPNANAAPNPTDNASANPKPKPRRFGGDVQAGQSYIVGEVEPEVFIPRESGVILNREQAARNLDLLLQVGGRSLPPTPATVSEPTSSGIATLIQETRALRETIEARRPEIPVMINGDDRSDYHFERFLRLQRSAIRSLF